MPPSFKHDCLRHHLHEFRSSISLLPFYPGCTRVHRKIPFSVRRLRSGIFGASVSAAPLCSFQVRISLRNCCRPSNFEKCFSRRSFVQPTNNYYLCNSAKKNMKLTSGALMLNRAAFLEGSRLCTSSYHHFSEQLRSRGKHAPQVCGRGGDAGDRRAVDPYRIT